MATIRQPFAPLNGSRLQNLTSLKNRQNATPSPSSTKRKAAETVDTDDSENVDPMLFSKRLKGSNDGLSKDSFIKPSNFILTKSASTHDISASSRFSSPRPRSILNPKSPVARLSTGIVKSSPLSAPAGRSPTRGKKNGLLSSSRRRTAGPYSRVDPPAFGLSSKSAAPFSLDAALKGTLSSYASRETSSATISTSSSTSLGLNELHEGEMKSSWFFEIHEDTAEQEMTNLLQHSTCVLDISSDEETESRRQRERAEGKENVPPADDVSQTSRPRAARQAADADGMVFEKERSPLGEMNVRDYFSEGCDENSVIIVPGDDEEVAQQPQVEAELVSVLADASTSNEPLPAPFVPSADEGVPAVVVGAAVEEQGVKTAEELMQKVEEPAPCAAVLEPIEGTGESFELWESGSAKDETEQTLGC
ncbi:uncharacterized protein B0I36DRAFT_373749 [Microdochium trichocladiopsis]|uniref:Thymidylate kinase n=1 Tax=Microdochium trichocladiopsis TaxID=1682393 RepID=A0A9P8Y7F3_9PEZI|nr:uncharacterized protein B0I36DRAFT_373749 [Microdochium trichocladiopsis]KAH7033570.1 hypothetical protein B0I36DRAFT_373749 [Microdochium trichocladiopsis]